MQYKLASYVLKRYEPDIDGGTLCLFNAKNNSFWFGNFTALFLINKLDGNSTLDELKNEFVKTFNLENSIDDVFNSIDTIFSELLDKAMIVEVK